ncbi:MAG TPA: DUF58 domain-containing protein [Planctomycetota bacterium]|nr:DUF58 domain-containing protein [Planctomycetota bacterium]
MTSDAAETVVTPDDLLTPGFMKKLERFRMCSRVIHPGASMGERVSRARGSGMEFADHKEYSPGDDFRMIDWNVYARLDEFVVKVFETEENLSVCVLLDVSASMDFGAGTTKWVTAARLAAALGYIALVNRDALTVFRFAETLSEPFEAARGRGHLRQMLRRLSTGTPAGQTDFVTSLRAAGMQLHRPGVCFVISDFCTADPSTSLGAGPSTSLGASRLAEALKGLVYYGHEIVALHVLDPLEADPGLEGELDVEDAETGELVPMTVKADTLRRYREAFEHRCRAVAAACAAYDAKYLRISTTDSLENTVLYRFRREGIVE